MAYDNYDYSLMGSGYFNKLEEKQLWLKWYCAYFISNQELKNMNMWTRSSLEGIIWLQEF